MAYTGEDLNHATRGWVKGRSAINVKDYGADNTGSVDATSIIQSCLSLCATIGGGDVLLQEGEYKFSDTLLIGDNTHLKGIAGQRGTYLVPTSEFVAAVTVNYIANSRYATTGMTKWNSNRDIKISGITFKYQDTTPGSEEGNNAIGLNNCKNVEIYDCSAYNMCQHLVDISGCQNVNIHDLECNTGYWAGIQIDQGAGLYGAATDVQYPSSNIVIRDCKFYNMISNRGAIQIHKEAGDIVKIERCYMENCQAGITTDIYYDDNWGISYNSNLFLNKNVIISTVTDSVGIRISKKYSNASISDNFIDVKGKALLIRGGSDDWSPSMGIINNHFKGSSSYIVGIEDSIIQGNNFVNNSAVLDFSCRTTQFLGNIITGYGVNLLYVTETDVRDSSTYTYKYSSLTFVDNIFKSSLGDNKSFILSGTDFTLVTFKNNFYFTTGAAFDFTSMSVLTGIAIDDYFRKSMRVVTTAGRLTNGLLPGTQSYDSTIDKPIFRNAANTNWIDAAGNVV